MLSASHGEDHKMEWSKLDASSVILATFHDGFNETHGYLRLMEYFCTGDPAHDEITQKVSFIYL